MLRSKQYRRQGGRLVLAAVCCSGSAFEVQGSPASWLLQGAAVIGFYI
jgi:hypothetical protein